MRGAGMSAGTVVLVGCGQMGSAMLRGWLARGAAARFHRRRAGRRAGGASPAAAIVAGIGDADELPDAI